MLPDPGVTMEVSPADVAAWIGLPAGERPLLVDCREADELAICRLEGHEWFPLGTLPASVERIAGNAARGVVVYCHHGMRSLRAAGFLRAHGIESTFSMRGGIDRWSLEIDPAVPRY